MGSQTFPILVLIVGLVVLLTACNGWLAVETQQQASRWKRQAGRQKCSGDVFRCTSGECIDRLSVCDGAINCSDQSDETAETCGREPCPLYAFRCNYGGCISMMSKCDGEDDCADRSDETHLDCSMRCRDDEFECDGDGSCIDELMLCDGNRDCEDGSDEGAPLCANMSCPSYAFRCKYGGCIDRTKLCDGKQDCIDSSDETPALCRSQTVAPTRSTTAKPISGIRPNTTPAVRKPSQGTTAPPIVTSESPGPQCVLPNPILNGRFSIGGCEASDLSPLCRGVSGTATLLSTVLLHACDNGFTLSGNTFSVCQGNSRWTPPIPTCTQSLVMCPPLVEVSVEITCSLATVAVNCSHPAAPATEARLKCNQGYTLTNEPNYRKIVCLPTGAWNKPLFTCIPDCGKRNPNGRPFISNGEVAQVGEYPWHSGVYRNNSLGSYDQVCGGTLITPKLVISAAHCFWNEGYSRKEDKGRYKIALGKFHRDWNTIDDEEQKFDIEEIIVDERYRGRKRNYQFDIAIIQLKSLVELTWAVNIACVDWDNELERFQLAPGQNGTVTGWGITEENEPSVFLKSVELPYVELFPTCYNTVAENFQPYLTSDKFCAGYTNNRTSVCPGDSGGGLLFQHATTKRYYLRGIVSVGSKPDTNSEKCYTQAFTAFSKFSESLRWVEAFQSM